MTISSWTKRASSYGRSNCYRPQDEIRYSGASRPEWELEAVAMSFSMAKKMHEGWRKVKTLEDRYP